MMLLVHLLLYGFDGNIIEMKTEMKFTNSINAPFRGYSVNLINEETTLKVNFVQPN